MRRIMLIVLVLVGIALPLVALAQEVAPEESAPTFDPALGYVLFTVVLLGILATVVVVGRPLVRYAGENAPRWAFEVGVQIGAGLVKTAEEIAKATPATYDDPVAAELRRQYEMLVEEARGEGKEEVI
jgi:hypothetical protein